MSMTNISNGTTFNVPVSSKCRQICYDFIGGQGGHQLHDDEIGSNSQKRKCMGGGGVLAVNLCVDNGVECVGGDETKEKN